MTLWELFILAVGLSMDACAVALCKGLALRKARLRDCALVGLWFGGFQALMPLIGFFLGRMFAAYITAVDHWIAFALLVILGINMLREALSGQDECEDCSAGLDVRTMFTMALATSIDALAVGVTFAFLQVQIIPAVSFIGVITFTISFLSVKIGSLFGAALGKKAELLGGAVLILMGVKILLEHLDIFG